MIPLKLISAGFAAPDVLPQPPFVPVKGPLGGANPIAASAIVMLVEKH